MLNEEFDDLTHALKKVWDKVDHPHKSLVTETHLNATTGYDIEFPNIVKFCVYDILKSV